MQTPTKALYRTAVSATASLLILAGSLGVTQPVSAHSAGADCNRNVTVHVALAPGQPATSTLAGTLCTPHGHGGSSIDVLIHGATYDRSYWDFAYDYPYYSYAQRAVQAGHSVFYYDRLGNGQSSRLQSAAVTMDSDAYALHQVIGYLHSARHYHTVNVVGHSFGSLISLLEASTYNDMDRLVVTGSLQSTGPANVNGWIQTHPANQDAQFAGQGYDDGWVTSVPGSKALPFYNTASADPNVIAYDDAHEGIESGVQLAQGRAQRVLDPTANPTNKVRVPVLIVEGEEDALYCGISLDCTDKTAILNFEAPYYTKAQSLQIATIPDTGHDINLHPNIGKAVKTIDSWLQTTPPYNHKK